ncbi:DUF1491 family protein [Sphingopyxis sp. MWB1]|uniref:DUF1491 family protein n=1 Tax=Sphingopyxis sp. MWB1 TaxID=1537715 RepID=UPI00051A832E|nr:DUF1491 family protein [Sphingopyxis sp. MWB1]
MTRLTSRFLVDLLRRRAEAAGGFATILTIGDEHAGSILVQCCERGVIGPLFERRFAMSGQYQWEIVGPPPEAGEKAHSEYRARRKNSDPDIWIIELDIADAPRFVAEWGDLA